MKQRITKYLLMAIGLAFTGEAYLVVDEMRQLRSTARSAIDMAEQVSGALGATTRTLNTVVTTQRKLVVASKSAGSQCVKAGGEAQRIAREVEELRREIEKLRKKLRFQLKVFEELPISEM